MEKKRVAIVGAGVCGLISIKCCLDEELEPVCFELSDNIGGLWRYEEKATDGLSCVMKTTVINTSKEMMAFSDFPIPADFPNYMHNTKVMDYFIIYAKHFQLLKHIQYRTEVVSVRKAEDFDTTGRWVLKIKEVESGKERTEVFDAVLICTGHHADKKMPNFAGHEEFQGQQMHTHDYKSHKGLEDKVVVVVGIGNSGGDVAVELSKIAKQVYLSTRRGAWCGNRVGDQGLPTDINLTKRISQALVNRMPTSLFNNIVEKKLNQRMDHEHYGLRPKHRFNEQHPTVNDELPNRIICGSVQIKPDIRRLTRTGVEFEDGTKVDDVDVMIYATGYKFGFPFVDKSVLNIVDNKAPLFKYCFPPDVSPATLAVMGMIQPWGAIMPISELQCRWATRVFKGTCCLPSREEMWRDVRAKEESMANRYVQSTRHTIQVDWIPFMDEVAEQCGCKPDLWKLLFKDPALAWTCFFGPCTPYQYRLHGPLPWSGARDAIMTQMERVRRPLQTRLPHVPEPSATSRLVQMFVIGIILALLYWWLF